MTPTASPTSQPTDAPTTASPTFAPTASGVPSQAPTGIIDTILPCIQAVPGKDSNGSIIITVDIHYSNLDPDTRDYVDNCERDDDPHCPITDLTPLPSDWFGIYPCSARDPWPLASSPSFNFQPMAWAYTCYTGNCRRAENATSDTTIVFADDTAPLFGTEGYFHQPVSTLPPGCYTVLLNRIEGWSAPPYYNICAGNDFVIE
eukprot:CAMPEP_0178935948 /NCGR_PEP_ID=MMETSP0786-20121207/24861_1 /TAXON_ID=186022 /ORGANISM="Thalassionema frauenfeldii, Strain CCMP 1798" /LENGTH=202 /DNA_ID=CAMNT_0020614217 /DNA_START=231 /DNA_END=839 /DNA_ORIENTATION=+